MGRTATVIRAIAKMFAWALGVLIFVLLLWFIANRLLDPRPSPERKALSALADIQIQDNTNVAIGILGITAPKGSDFIQHGTRVKALLAANAPYAEIQEMLRGPKALRPTVAGNQVDCWLDPDWMNFKDCLPFDKAPAVIADNKELLERYKRLYALGHYEAEDIYFNDAYLVLVRLSVAEIQVDLRKGSYEAAYRKWQQQLQFVKRNLRGTDTWVGKAVGLVAMGMTLPVLDSLLVASPSLAKAHASELHETLRPEGMAAFNPNGIVRAEFKLLNKALEHPPVELPEYGIDRLHWLTFYLGQKNRILNRYAIAAPEYAATLQLPWSDMENQVARLREKYVAPSTWEFVLDPFGTLFIVQYMESQLRAREMVRQMHMTEGRMRLATLLVNIINEDVGDRDIPRFLASVDPRFFDPFSATPARWDPKDRKIYFVDPTDKCTVGSWFRVRDLKRSQGRSSSLVNTNAC